MPVLRLIRLSVLLVTVAVAVVLAPSAFAQGGARLFGVVTDHEGTPVEGATVLIEFTGGLNRTFELTTNDAGEYLQVGLGRGSYDVTFVKEGIGGEKVSITLIGRQELELDQQFLAPGEFERAGLSEEDLAKLETAEATSGAFTDGVAAARAGNLDEAVELFTEAVKLTPDCSGCFRNLGIVEFQRENYDAAESALRQATELNPDDAEAFDGLADLYNAQSRFDEAGEASAAARRLSGGAAGGEGDAGGLFDQGLIAWNSGRIDEARGLFEQTLALDPDHGEANYWMGMASLNGGQIPEAVTFMRTYLEREPDGRFAAEATGLLAQLAP